MFPNLKIKTKLAVIFFGTLFLVVGAFYINNEFSLRNLFNTEISDDASETNQIFSNILADERDILGVSLDVLEGDQEAGKLFAKKDREVLYVYMLPIFKNLKSRYQIDTLEFYLPDGTNLLRVQDKAKFGDKGEHSELFQEVMSTKREASGFDVEDSDLAFRLVRPYKFQNRIIGYIEIGEGINHILAGLQRGANKNFSVYINKATLSEDSLSELKQRASEKNLLETPGYVEVYTMGSNKIINSCFSDQVAVSIQTKGPELIKFLRDGSKDYNCSGFGIPWSQGRNSAVVLSLEDITLFTGVFNNNRLVFVTLSVILFTLFFIIINYLTTKTFSDPLSKLNEATQKIAEGNLNQKVEINSKDEIGQLALSFNNMTDKLRQSYESLGQKIKERTVNLEEKTKQLEIKNKDTEERDTAILNILEDLDKEKSNLERSNAKEEAFLQSVGEGLIVVNQEGQVIMASKTALELTGCSKDQLYGKIWAKEILTVEDEYGREVPYEKTAVYGALHNKGTSTIKFFYKLDGYKFPVLITAAPVILNGQNQGAVVVFRDITREEEIDKAKSEFISLASHQLRTPLSAIKWFVELLFETKGLTKEQTEFMTNISKSTERMIELVNALLNISRIESGKIAVNPQPTNLAKLINDTISVMKRDIDAKRLQLITIVDPDLPEINVDQKMIGVVYENLVSNAIKYTPHNGKITVKLYKAGNEIISKVTDTGLGISKKDFGRIFSKFYRGDNVIKVEFGGTGLGLYLAKAIVDSSKGRIGFESEEGKGTTFWFSLPIGGMPAKEGDVVLA